MEHTTTWLASIPGKGTRKVRVGRGLWARRRVLVTVKLSVDRKTGLIVVNIVNAKGTRGTEVLRCNAKTVTLLPVAKKTYHPSTKGFQMKRRLILGLILASAVCLGAAADAFCYSCTTYCYKIGFTQFCDTNCY